MSSDEREVNGAVATDVFAMDAELDDQSYLADTQRRCPQDGLVMPIALPYAYEQNADEAAGYSLVCPHCRFSFEKTWVNGDPEWYHR